MTSPSQTACEMSAYIHVAIQAARYLRKPEPTDDELRMWMIEDRFTAAEVEQDFAEAKKIAGC